MKKLLLLFVSIIALQSCSTDDSVEMLDPIPTVEVLDYSYEVALHDQIGYQMEFTAVVKNNTATQATGKVRFTVPAQGSSWTYSYIENVELNPGETKVVSGVDGPYFQGETINITEAAFVTE